MLEGIHGVEKEHANDMHDLLVAHEGRQMLPEGVRAACFRGAKRDHRHRERSEAIQAATARVGLDRVAFGSR